MRSLPFGSGAESPPGPAVSLFREMGAYEALWDRDASFKKIADRFRDQPNALPSDFVDATEAIRVATWVLTHLRSRGITVLGVRLHRTADYPRRLRDAKHPVELLYFQGNWDLVETRCIAVVGTRHPSPEGVKRTKQLVRQLVKDKWTIVSGLAEGIDTVAHETAIEEGGSTIGVIGTPLSEVYPKSNRVLQERIAQNYLLISQVPVYAYEHRNWKLNRFFFPERNITMSALSEATVIVEAGQTSGTLAQAKAAIHQKRKLFILDSLFLDTSLTWPSTFELQGAIRVKTYDQIAEALPPDADPHR